MIRELWSDVSFLFSPVGFIPLTFQWTDLRSKFKDILKEHSTETRSCYFHATTVTVRSSFLVDAHLLIDGVFQGYKNNSYHNSRWLVFFYYYDSASRIDLGLIHYSERHDPSWLPKKGGLFMKPGFYIYCSLNITHAYIRTYIFNISCSIVFIFSLFCCANFFLSFTVTFTHRTLMQIQLTIKYLSTHQKFRIRSVPPFSKMESRKSKI